MNFMTFYIGNFIIPTDELIFFQRGRYTTNQYLIKFDEIKSTLGRKMQYLVVVSKMWIEVK